MPDPFAIAILAATIAGQVMFRIGAFKLMGVGAVLGVLRSRLPAIPGFKAVADALGWATV